MSNPTIPPAPADSAGTSPSRHLLTLIVDALSAPEPRSDPQNELLYLQLLARRSALVLDAARTALSTEGDRGTHLASERLYAGVSDVQAEYARATVTEGTSR